ncbi:hypothetical protein FDK38_003683 [Candidozyma auris]|nr:hypothetical protein FDK38_003683 [[Candida] auris]
MKKYQLMGRRKVAASKPGSPKYPLLHLHSLPYEILSLIFGYLASDIATLLRLSMVCQKFHNIVCKNYVYHSVIFKSTAHFLRFAAIHLSSRTSLARRFGFNEPSSMINYLRKVYFVNPPTNNSASSSTKIAGTYNVENVNRSSSMYDTWVTHFKCLLNEAYGLKEVVISEISPQFEFPIEFMAPTSSPKFPFKRQAPARTLERLVLTAQSGWTIPFKVGQMSIFAHVFDHIDELRLDNFVLNEGKLLGDAWELKLSVGSFVACACIYTDTKRPTKRRCTGLFSSTRSLSLLELENGADLSLIDSIKSNGRLSRLVIDIGSKVFYTSGKTFNFAKFNSFFKLVCSGQGSYSGLREIVLINFDLFHDFSHQHEKRTLEVIREDSESASLDIGPPPEEPSNNTFEYLLRYLSQVPNLTIVIKERPKVMHTCVKCGFTVEESCKKISSLLPHEWSIILAPVLLNPKCSVNIYDHSWSNLFTRKARLD